MSIAFNSILTGYLFYEGAVFCTHPTWGYAPGAFGLGKEVLECFRWKSREKDEERELWLILIVTVAR